MATTTDNLWVLDTSIAVAWFLVDDEQHERAMLVRRAIRRMPRTFVVSQLFHSELAHVLARSRRDPEWVRLCVSSVIRFGIQTVALADSALLRIAHWACKGLGGYDGTHVALAEDLGGRWLTADTKAAKIANEHAVTLLGWSRMQR